MPRVPLPARAELPALPEPRLTFEAGGPPPVFEAGIPGRPRWPRFTELVAGRFDGAMGLSGRPRATADGCEELLGTDAACGWARLTTAGAAGAITRFGGAGATAGAGCVIFTIFGGSGAFTTGTVIFGGTTFTTFGSGGRGSTFGWMIGGAGFKITGSTSVVTRGLLSLIFLAARPRMTTMMASSTLIVI